jgi:hypothetical protein
MDLRAVGWGDMDWIDVAQDAVQCSAFVNIYVTTDHEIIFYLHCFIIRLSSSLTSLLVLAIAVVYMHDITPSALVILKNY